jgi:hypothetical protein
MQRAATAQLDRPRSGGLTETRPRLTRGGPLTKPRWIRWSR